MIKKEDVKYHFDFRVANGTYNPKNILQTLQKMRKDINQNRTGQIKYCIQVDHNIPLHYKNEKQKTQKGDYFIVTIDRKTLYPKGFKNGTRYTIQKNQDKQPCQLTAATYTGTFHLSDLLGILVAEQLRFNTFELAFAEEKFRLTDPKGTMEIFLILQKYMKSYQNWQSGQIDKNVQILVPFKQ